MNTIGALLASLGIGWALWMITMCIMDLGRRAMRHFEDY